MKGRLMSREELDDYQKRFEEWLDKISIKNPRTGLIRFVYVPELNGLKVGSGAFSKMMKKYGINLTKQEWVNLHMFGDKDFYPICQYCGERPYKFNIWTYRSSCCTHECKGKRVSEDFKNEEYRTKNLAARAKTYATPEHKARMSVICTLKAAKERDEGRGIFSKEAKEKCHGPEGRKRQSEITKALWNDPEYRNKNSKSHKDRYAWDDELVDRMVSNLNMGNERFGKKSKLFSTYENMEIRFDSSWERKFYEFMSSKPEVKHISRRYVKFIRYFSSDKGRIARYKPDFVIEYADGKKELIEIKPRFKLEYTDTLEKKEAAIEWCKENGMTYKLLCEDDLTRLGVKL